MNNQQNSDTEWSDSPASIPPPPGVEPEHPEAISEIGQKVCVSTGLNARHTTLQPTSLPSSASSSASSSLSSSAIGSRPSSTSAPQTKRISRSRSRSRGHDNARSNSHSRSSLTMQTVQDRFPYTHYLQDVSVPSALSLARYVPEHPLALSTNTTTQWQAHPSLAQNEILHSVVDPQQTHTNSYNVANLQSRQLNSETQPSASKQTPQITNVQSQYDVVDNYYQAASRNDQQMHSHHHVEDQKRMLRNSPSSQFPPFAESDPAPSLGSVWHSEGDFSNTAETSSILQQSASSEASIWRRHNSAPQPSETKLSIDANRISKRQCPLCHKFFSSFTAVQAHSLVHSGHRPYRCPYPNCAKSFNVKSNMVRHYKLHTKKSEIENASELAPKSPKDNHTEFS
ncbi:LAFA_0F08086g1_1 [Lachancea sp. 'fantastica']|nr:LAFA_0F08086g1_1 [Lachancea sp. 'fantastica']